MPTSFVASSAAFAKALAQVTPVISTKPLVPAAEQVLLVGTGSVVGQAASIRLLATNLETTLAVRLDVEATENFAALVPAKKLLDTLKSLPDQPITFTVNEQAHTLELKAARSKYSLGGLNPQDFPKVPALNKRHHALTLPGNVLRAGLQAALVTARKDDLGVEFENVLVQVAENSISGYTVNFVGADNPNVAVYSYVEHEDVDFTTFEFMLRREPAQYLAGLLSDKNADEVTLLADGVNVRLKDGRWASRLAEGTYPDYQRVMPTESPNSFLCDAGELLAAVRRLDKYATGDTRSITLQFCEGAEVSLSVEDMDLAQSGDETVAGDYSGEELSINFNATKLAALLALFSGNIELGFAGPDRAVVITAPEIEGPQSLTCMLSSVRNLVAA